MKKIAIPFFLLFLLLFAFGQCQKSNAPIDVSGCNFYFWKTRLSFNAADKALADSLGVERLYLRYFDVDWSPSLGMPVPVGEITLTGWSNENFFSTNEAYFLDDRQVVPVVYLENRVFSGSYDPDSLAAKISDKIASISREINWYLYPSWGYDYANAEDSNYEVLDSLYEGARQRFFDGLTEIQLDCDWTATTRERYFQFLKAMKKYNPDKTISCTVRLHQFRDQEKTGVPPVDRGTLMCYNMASPKDPGVSDAIFDPALVQGYLKNGDYPLPLEAALPLFSWGVLFHENEFKGLASGLSAEAVQSNPLFEAGPNGMYRFTADTVFSEIYMRRGDLVRIDQASPDELAALMERLAQIKAVKNISFFDWNPSNIRIYHVDELYKKFQAAR